MKQFTLDFEKPIRELELKIKELEELSKEGKMGLDGEMDRLRAKTQKLRKEVYSNLSRWQRVQLARHPMRPFCLDYIERISTGFMEIHGDRNFRDDKAIVAGIGYLKRFNSKGERSVNEHRVAIIGQQKGRGTKDNLKRNFGMPNPEGYRKALRIMKMAEKFALPILTLIDTPGAYPGLGAEERGQASAIAENLYAMAGLKVPLIAIVIGEGGSGGALALGVADRVYMLENSIYSVITPEGCASILYRDASHAQTAAEAMKLTAHDQNNAGLIDGLISEPLGGAHNDIDQVAVRIAETATNAFDELLPMDPEERIQKRIEKYAYMGDWRD